MILAASAGAWLYFASDEPVITRDDTTAAVQTAELQAEVDLRKYAVTRSDQKLEEPPAVSMPRGRLTLTILLPVGSEPGEYEVQVLDFEQRSIVSATGEAEIRDFITTLQATVDTGSLSLGSYQLAIRRQGEEWQLFPARVE